MLVCVDVRWRNVYVGECWWHERLLPDHLAVGLLSSCLGFAESYWAQPITAGATAASSMIGHFAMCPAVLIGRILLVMTMMKQQRFWLVHHLTTTEHCLISCIANCNKQPAPTEHFTGRGSKPCLRSSFIFFYFFTLLFSHLYRLLFSFTGSKCPLFHVCSISASHYTFVTISLCSRPAGRIVLLPTHLFVYLIVAPLSLIFMKLSV